MNRLRSYRHIEQINQEQLGRMLGVSAQAVSAVESGRRPPSFDLSISGYSEEKFEVAPMSEPLHRQRASTRVSSMRRAKELLRVGGELFTGLAGVTQGTPELRVERYGSPQGFDEIEELAMEVRIAVLLQESDGPIRNLTAAAERAGLCLVPIVGLAGIDGLSSWVDEQPVVGLSPSVPGDRFRFSLSHELGHLVLHSRRSGVTEDEANRFAGALLIPQSDMDEALPAHPTLRDFVGMKSVWGISVAALVYRAHELGYLDDRRYRSIQIQMSSWRRSEPGEFDPATPRLLPRLVAESGGPDAAARMTGLNRDHINDTITWRRLRSA